MTEYGNVRHDIERLTRDVGDERSTKVLEFATNMANQVGGKGLMYMQMKSDESVADSEWESGEVANEACEDMGRLGERVRRDRHAIEKSNVPKRAKRLLFAANEFHRDVDRAMVDVERARRKMLRRLRRLYSSAGV